MLTSSSNTSFSSSMASGIGINGDASSGFIKSEEKSRGRAYGQS
uniref:Uncharacterized protein n=1 Tax=Manihot esculenta TaxID=3983 RepID=A0A2C9U4N1_MANES